MAAGNVSVSSGASVEVGPAGRAGDGSDGSDEDADEDEGESKSHYTTKDPGASDP